MDKNQIFALVAAILAVGGVSIGVLNYDKPIYQCESKNLISNCEKLGAEATRCYYNATAPLKYSFCSEGWHVITTDNINPENSGTSDVLIKSFNQIDYRCEVEGCKAWQ
jgi:hypothetical protein